MSCENHRWQRDPAKWEACGRLERLGAAIGPIDDDTEHVELKRHNDGTPIGDADIPAIVDDMNVLEDATTLDLSESAITDRAASYLGQLRTVTALYLGGTRLTDASIPLLAAIPNLRELVLSGTDVTDAGLDCLAAAHKLAFLQLIKTKVSMLGVARLQHALPGLYIEHRSR
jgi:hypothetical protein